MKSYQEWSQIKLSFPEKYTLFTTRLGNLMNVMQSGMATTVIAGQPQEQQSISEIIKELDMLWSDIRNEAKKKGDK